MWYPPAGHIWQLRAWDAATEEHKSSFDFISVSLIFKTDTQFGYWKAFRYVWDMLGMWINFFNYKCFEI